MPVAATVATVVSAGASMLGSMKQAQGQEYQAQAAANAARYNAQVAANNSLIAKQNADFAAAQGNAKVEQQQLKNRAEIGAITAAQAGSGVDLNSGSFVDVRSSARETGQLSAINIRSEAARQAYGYQNEAAGYTAQSGLDKAEAQNDITAGKMAAQSTIIGGVADAGSSFYQLQQSGGLGSLGGSSSSDITDYNYGDTGWSGV